MPTTVRLATASDAAALAQIAAITFPLACPPDATEEAKASFVAEQLSPERFAEYLADPARRLLLAEDEAGASVGYTMLIAGESTDADVAASLTVRPSTELSKCYVHPDHHGAGVAADLVAASVERARADGAAAVWLGVNQQNARANRFYEKHGFVRVGAKRFRLGDRWEDDFVRERVFSGAAD